MNSQSWNPHGCTDSGDRKNCHNATYVTKLLEMKETDFLNYTSRVQNDKTVQEVDNVCKNINANIRLINRHPIQFLQSAAPVGDNNQDPIIQIKKEGTTSAPLFSNINWKITYLYNKCQETGPKVIFDVTTDDTLSKNGFPAKIKDIFKEYGCGVLYLWIAISNKERIWTEHPWKIVEDMEPLFRSILKTTLPLPVTQIDTVVQGDATKLIRFLFSLISVTLPLPGTQIDTVVQGGV